MSILNAFNSLFKSSSHDDLKDLINKGAILIDVRTRTEFNGGHVKNSKNIPLDEIDSNLSKLDKQQTFILVCASGMRSRSATSMLKRNGFGNVYDGGCWSRFI